MHTTRSPSTAPERHKLAEFTSFSAILSRGSKGVVDMFRDTRSRRGHAGNFRKPIDQKPDLSVSHGQGSEKDWEGPVRQILQACKVSLLPLCLLWPSQPSIQRTRLPSPFCVQADTAEQKVRLPGIRTMLYRLVCCAWRLVTGC